MCMRACVCVRADVCVWFVVECLTKSGILPHLHPYKNIYLLLHKYALSMSTCVTQEKKSNHETEMFICREGERF